MEALGAHMNRARENMASAVDGDELLLPVADWFITWHQNPLSARAWFTSFAESDHNQYRKFLQVQRNSLSVSEPKVHRPLELFVSRFFFKTLNKPKFYNRLTSYTDSACFSV